MWGSCTVALPSRRGLPTGLPPPSSGPGAVSEQLPSKHALSDRRSLPVSFSSAPASVVLFSVLGVGGAVLQDSVRLLSTWGCRVPKQFCQEGAQTHLQVHSRALGSPRDTTQAPQESCLPGTPVGVLRERAGSAPGQAPGLEESQEGAGTASENIRAGGREVALPATD